MVGHQWLPWINNPTSGSASVSSAKQEQEISSGCLRTRRNTSCRHSGPVVALSTLCSLLLAACVALSVLYNNESDRRPTWKNLLFNYQNISESCLALTKANSDLRGENERLRQRSTWLDAQNKLLNRTSAQLMSVNLALSLESTELTEQIVNLTSTNLELAQEHQSLVQHRSEQEEEKLNMSQTIKHLVNTGTRQEEEARRLSELNGLLRDELFQLREKNEELLENNHKFDGEIKNLSEQVRALLIDDCDEAKKHNMQLQERVTKLQERSQNLSSTLTKERQEAAEREESRRNEMDRVVADMRSVKEAFHSLDLYCPVLHHQTKERVCKKCQNSWRLFENKCYYFSTRMLTWSSSRAWCQTQGGDLLIVDSEAEQSFVFESSRAVEQSGSRLWIGMTDAEVEGEWLWVDGSSVASRAQYWLSRAGTGTEPDDWKLDDPLGEDCGHIDTSENALKSWMDGSCTIPYRWICEKNV
ncbi:CD209 antigen-like protein B [Chelmon rostratus]|uniref:CD209 antigen-like protein B n=1 Tax=Chelmon rostratus TaxID=109905 RepID=UPI001BEBB672|nr:CD209 antigen-like protein B [Chelmon rostratus]